MKTENKNIRISAISYLNSLPFAWCLEHSDIHKDIELFYDIPSQCAEKLIADKIDIGLIPIVEVLQLPEYHIVSDMCIGSTGSVRTVILASQVPLNKISTIYIDEHSRTSAALIKILAKLYWKIDVRWENFAGDITMYPIENKSAALIIGDKAFDINAPYIYDLALEWHKFSGLPFVFACWVANKQIDSAFINRFNAAFASLTDNLPIIADYYKNKAPQGVDLLEYWKNNISYPLTADKRRGMDLFLQNVL